MVYVAIPLEHARAIERIVLHLLILLAGRDADVSRSTLRLTLGVLLSDTLGLELAPHHERLNFGVDGEARLSSWMAENARVTWTKDQQPWIAEHELLHTLDLPLNVDGNMHHPFARVLSDRRIEARRLARTAAHPTTAPT